MIKDETWWVSTQEFLPNEGERVLIITKFGNISNAMYGGIGNGKPRFEPYGLEPDKDVKWWMAIPSDGWKSIKEEQPAEGEAALTMGYYGNIFSGKWKRPAGAKEFSFQPFVWEVLYWREMPPLPEGVILRI